VSAGARGESLLRAVRRLLTGCDGLVVSSIVNVRYLTGFRGSTAYALVLRDAALFFTDFRYQEQAEAEVREPWSVVVGKGTARAGMLREIVNRKVARLGFESSAPFELYEELRGAAGDVQAVGDRVARLREVKTAEEIAAIREAVRRAEVAYREVGPRIRAGVTERAIANRLEERLRREGCRRAPFDIIVASGPNSSRPHAGVTDRKVRPGDLVTVDWGGEADGYCSDMTRTVLVAGKETARKKAIHGLVLRANRAGVRSVRAGLSTRTVDRAARRVIDQAGYGEYFGHGTGHGIGLDVHERPALGPRGTTRIRSGMVFTVEPGVYVPGLGGVRIEDMVLVTGKGYEELTALPRELEIIS
jgi:Xaa-Pro aminopeptidase